MLVREALGVAGVFRVNPLANADRTHRIGVCEFPPAFLMGTFGPHDKGDGLRSSGGWIFENDAGDVFTLYEYMQTQLSLGRRSGAPAVSDFWSQTTPATFHIGGRETSNVETFRTWLEV